MKLLFAILFVLIVACNTKQQSSSLSRLDSIFNVEQFDTSISYSDPCCLLYKGKPLLTIGQNIKNLDPTFSYSLDANGKYSEHLNLVRDHISIDDYFSDDPLKGKITGVVYFSSDGKGRIFNVGGSWTINGDLIDTSGLPIMSYLYKIFPCMPADFKEKKNVNFIHKNFTENLKLFRSSDSADIDHGFIPHWVLSYSVLLSKKNG